MPNARAWRLRVSIAAALLALVAGCASEASPPPPTSAAPPVATVRAHTRPITFVPTATPTTSVSGSCWTSSITVSDPHAYRCFVGRQILDPCFARAGRVVDCYAAPWAEPVRVRLGAPLPAASPIIVTRPWAIQLGGGIRCVAATGAVTEVGGVPMLYRCAGGAAAGGPTTVDGVARVRYLAPGAHRTVTAVVAVTWST